MLAVPPTYRAFGLRIRSPIPLAGVPPAAGQSADVAIEFGPVELPADSAEGHAVASPSGGLAFRVTPAGSFLVRNGREIVVDPKPGAHPSLLRAMLLGPAMGILLRQRGLLVLHGSAIELSGVAVAFVGDKGAGKSTAAAAMHSMGHRVITDDIVAIRVDDDGDPQVVAGYPQLNVWPDTATSLGHDVATLPRLNTSVEKRVIQSKDETPGTVPLRRVYVLETGADTGVEPLEPQAGLVELLRHSYGVRSLRDESPGRHFQGNARLIELGLVRRLTIRRSLEHLARLAEVVEQDIAARPGTG